MAPTPSRLTLERLEDRCVPATWGNPWPDAAHLTVSFAPDGTTLGAQASSLFSSLNSVAPTATWQRAVLRAFQTWAAEAGVNFGVVGDGGQAFGAAGRPQSDSRFGDVRVGAATSSNEVLIYSAPFDLTAGTLSGDVRFNSAAWVSGTKFDVYTAMLQEAGHVLGVGNSDDPASVMYEEYQGTRSGLSAGDVAAVRALYGTRLPDSYEGSAGNNTLATPSRLNLLKDANGLLNVTADADLGKGDRDVYSVTMPLTGLLGGLEVTLQRAGLSLLTPRVTVYDQYGRVVGSAVSTDPTGGDLKVRLNSVNLLATYRIVVEGASGDVFDVGSYRLQVRTLPVVGSLTDALLGTVDSTVQSVTGLLNNDAHTNDTFLTAGLLGGLLVPVTTQATSQFDVSYRASVSDSYDVDYYRVTAGQGGVMQLMAWGIDRNNNLAPKLTVYDAARNPVAAEVLVNEAGVMTLQLTGVTAGATYYVKVAASSGGSATGNYFLGIDYTDRAAQLITFADSQLDATKPTEQGTLHVARAGTFHFVLSASDSPGMAVEMTITDRYGNVVGLIRANSGDATSVTLTLTSGDYVVRMRAVSTDGRPVRPIRYRLTGGVLTDPIGPQGEDTTAEPTSSPSSTSSPPPPSGGSTTSAPPPSSTTTTSSDPGTSSSSSWYSWYGPPGTYGGPSSEDPYGSGYTV